MVAPPVNEIVIGHDQRPESLNPLAPGGDNQIVLEVNQAIGIGLTEIDGKTLELIPDLAVEIPSVANGGVQVAADGTTTVTYHLQPGAVWEDGSPITGHDIEFTYESIMDRIEQPFLREAYEPITSVVGGDHSATLTFTAPTLAFEMMFPFVIPHHQVEGTDPVADWLETPWMSAGPFTFESWEGAEIRLRRNERFWKTDSTAGDPLPRPDRLVFRWIPETEALVNAFADGEIDVVALWPWRPMIDRLEAIEGVEVTVRDSGIWEHITFQFGANNPNADTLNDHVEFRRAVALLLDPVAILELGLWANTTTLDSFLGLHGIPSADPWSRYAYDPDEANRLLSDLCAEVERDCTTDPPRVQFSTTSNSDERPQMARLLGDLLALGGIEVELDLQDSSLFFGSTLDNGAWDLAMWAWIAHPTSSGALVTLELFDPGAVVTGMDPRSRGETNYSRWGTAELCCWPPATERYSAILDEMRATADRALIFDLARDAEQILADQVVIIPLLARSSVGAVRADRVQGYIHSPWLDTWNVETWRRVDL